MSILIKGVGMPTNCNSCWALDDYGDYARCRITGEQCGRDFSVRDSRMDGCPLVPAADVRPVVRGRFIFDENDYLHCSECDCSFAALMYTVGSKLFVRPNFCPNCGAEMESGT